jgi:hypothetical protein
MDEDDLRQLVVPLVLWSSLVSWLGSRGLEVSRGPQGEDDLPTWYVTPGAALMARAEEPRVLWPAGVSSPSHPGARVVAYPDGRLVTFDHTGTVVFDSDPSGALP